jgi:hypothetical protein
MGIADNKLHAMQIALLQTAQEITPVDFLLRQSD